MSSTLENHNCRVKNLNLFRTVTSLLVRLPKNFSHSQNLSDQCLGDTEILKLPTVNRNKKRETRRKPTYSVVFPSFGTCQNSDAP